MTDHALAPLQSPHVVLHTMGLEFAPDIPYDEWERIGYQLYRIHSWVKFAIGDWIRFGEQAWGEMYAQAIEVTQLSESTLQDYVWVASKVDYSVRTEQLSWSHHKVVAREYFSTQPWLQKQELQEAIDYRFGYRTFEHDLRERYPEAFNGQQLGQGDTVRYCPTCGQVWEDDA